MRILLIEDDLILGDGLQVGLLQNNYAVDWLQNAESGEHALAVENYEALILDLSLPNKDGLSVLRDLRAAGNDIPVLILTARDTVRDRVSGLDLGADDYMVKPFALDELTARLRSLLRRRHGRIEEQIQHGNLILHTAARTASLKNIPLHLSAREFILLQALLEQRGYILSRSDLEERLYNWENSVESNVLEVHIHHLRKKLGKKFIRTVRGLGYTIETLDT